MATDCGAGPRAASGAGGRPDERFPRPVLRVPAAALAERVEGERQEVLVSVVATVNLTRKQGKIRFVNPIPSGRIAGLDGQGQVAIRGVGADGQLMREYAVQVNLFSELAPEEDREGLVDAVVPLPLDVRTIEVAIAGQVVDAVRVGGPLPALRGAQRLVSDDGELRLGLALDRGTEEGQTYAVQVSKDRGRTWQTMGVGLTEPVVALDRRQFHKGDELQVRVVATNGLSSVIVTMEPFRV